MASHQVLKRNILGLLCLLVVICCSGCVTYIGYDGPYEGRVIDAETRQPIEGAVVHGTWVRAHPGPGGASSSYYDSKEVLTDKKGNFKIKGVGFLILSNMEEMEINVFKAGYTQWSRYYWSSQKEPSVVPMYVEWEGDKAIIKLRRMNLYERRQRVLNEPDGPKKQKLFRLESNRENMEIGRPLEDLYKDLGSE